MSDTVLEEDTFLGILECIKGHIRVGLKNGTIQSGEEIDLNKLVINPTSARIHKITPELRTYRGVILGYSETSTRIPPGTCYRFTHGPGTSKLILHLVPSASS